MTEENSSLKLAKEVVENVEAQASQRERDRAVKRAVSAANAPLPPEVTDEFEFSEYNQTVSHLTGYKFLLYGVPGAGKTYCAATFPKPLFLDIEGGMQPVAFRKPLRWPKEPEKLANSYKQFLQFCKLAEAELAKPNPAFQTIVVDGLNEMQEVILRNIVATYTGRGVGERNYDDQPTQSDYGKMLRDGMKVFRKLFRLPCNVVYLAVATNRQYEDDKVIPQFIGKGTANEVMRLVSNVGYCYTVVNGDEIDYKVSFVDTPLHAGKDRLGLATKTYDNDFTKWGLK